MAKAYSLGYGENAEGLGNLQPNPTGCTLCAPTDAVQRLDVGGYHCTSGV